MKTKNCTIPQSDIRFIHFTDVNCGMGLYQTGDLLFCSMCFVHPKDQYDRKVARVKLAGRLTSKVKNPSKDVEYTFCCLTYLPFKDMKREIHKHIAEWLYIDSDETFRVVQKKIVDLCQVF